MDKKIEEKYYMKKKKERTEDEGWSIEKEKTLLPCPFCGGETIYINDGQLSHEACCDCCDARMNTYTYEMLLEQWNRRVCQCRKEN